MIDVEKLENLPKRESRKDYLTRKYGDMWNTRFDHSWMRSTKDQYAWVKAKRVIKHYLGKSYNEAFSKFCTLVPLHEQSEFLDEFNNRRWRFADYMIDDNGNIQLNPERHQNRKHPIVFQSFDYEVGYYNVVTKQIISQFEINKQSRESRYGWNRSYYRNNSNYFEVVVSGFQKTFETKKDLEYKKLAAEKRKLERLNSKAIKKYKREKAYCFLTDSELAVKKNKLEDSAIRDRHGFDETTFKGIEYHGQKRKLK